MVQTRIAPAGGVMLLSLSHEKSTDTQQKETAEKTCYEENAQWSESRLSSVSGSQA